MRKFIKLQTILLLILKISLSDGPQIKCVDFKDSDQIMKLNLPNTSLFDTVQENKIETTNFFRYAIVQSGKNSPGEKNLKIKQFRVFKKKELNYWKNELENLKLLSDRDGFEKLVGCYYEYSKNDVNRSLDDGSNLQYEKPMKYGYLLYESKIPYKDGDYSNLNSIGNFQKLTRIQRLEVFLFIATSLRYLEENKKTMPYLSFSSIRIDLENKGKAELINHGQICSEGNHSNCFEIKRETKSTQMYYPSFVVHVYKFGLMLAETEYGKIIYKSTNDMMDLENYKKIIFENISKIFVLTGINDTEFNKELNGFILECVEVNLDDRIKLDELVKRLEELLKLAENEESRKLFIQGI
jgi:hypothetical protein